MEGLFDEHDLRNRVLVEDSFYVGFSPCRGNISTLTGPSFPQFLSHTRRTGVHENY